MKYCSKCGRELLDKDIECDKCESTDFIPEKECEEIIKKINNSNMISKKKLLKDPIYKMVYDFIINKPKDYFNPCVSNSNNESSEEFFDRINRHTINKTEKLSIPHCPTCGSTNLSKISNVGKAAKIGLFGIFGAGDLGKTWKCNNCGSKW